VNIFASNGSGNPSAIGMPDTGVDDQELICPIRVSSIHRAGTSETAFVNYRMFLKKEELILGLDWD
jgi:hypothetical protein